MVGRSNGVHPGAGLMASDRDHAPEAAEDRWVGFTDQVRRVIGEVLAERGDPPLPAPDEEAQEGAS